MRERPFVCGVLLAAGDSERFPGDPKQLLPFGSQVLVRRVACQALDSRLDELIVVLGHEADRVESHLADLELKVVRNPQYTSGQASSVRSALAAIPAGTAAALFLNADQPFLSAQVIDQVIDAYRQSETRIVQVARGQRRGSPVLFDRSLFGELEAIEGDAGGRQILPRHCREVTLVELDSELPLLDVDTPAQYHELLALAGDQPESILSRRRP